ncbi:hypothetical protein [Solimonas soli]|uniref:hypothetical protein n=1 Tax=Solimonas soli TaxID=413479 RepID=UPI00048060E1|nr:hypothetical protein [Solimonas soli]
MLALGTLAWSFTPQTLPAAADGGAPTLAPLAAPVDLRFGVLETGAMQSNALFAYRGGSFEPRTFGMDVVVVEHPRGVLLFDAGFGRKMLEHVRTIPWLMRATQKTADLAIRRRGTSPGGLGAGDVWGLTSQARYGDPRTREIEMI